MSLRRSRKQRRKLLKNSKINTSVNKLTERETPPPSKGRIPPSLRRTPDLTLGLPDLMRKSTLNLT